MTIPDVTNRPKVVSDANITAFRDKAAEYDNENTQLISRVVATKVLQFDFASGSPSDSHHHPSEFAKSDFNFNSYDVPNVADQLWDPESTRVLDFACGTGLVSQTLAPYAKQIVGVDISPEMVEIFNRKISNQGIPESEMKAIVLDLLNDEEEEKNNIELGTFDAVVTSLAYHHIHDTDKATQKLANRLSLNGRLYVIDIEHGGGGSVHGGMTEEEALKGGVAHRGGLDPSVIVDGFTKAGLKDVTVTRAFRVKLWVPDEKVKTYSGLTGDTKVVNGETLHCSKVNLMLITGIKKQ